LAGTAVNFAGAAVTDVFGMYVTSDINHGVIAAWEYTGTPWEKTEEFEQSNPSRFLAGPSTPTLVIHGLNDERVPFAQGLTLYPALSDRGVDTKLLAYPREPHGFQGAAHIEHMLTAWGRVVRGSCV